MNAGGGKSKKMPALCTPEARLGIKGCSSWVPQSTRLRFPRGAGHLLGHAPLRETVQGRFCEFPIRPSSRLRD